MWAIPGHHLVGHVDVKNYSEEDLFSVKGAVPIELEPGDVSFHCLSAPHGSPGNRTPDLRRTFYVHYMNEEVLDQCYRHLSYIDDLEKERGLFDERARAAAHQMVEARQSLGYSGLDGCDVRLTNDGFEFTGIPGTPPRHWGTLIAAMSDEEIAQKQRLTYL